MAKSKKIFLKGQTFHYKFLSWGSLSSIHQEFCSLKNHLATHCGCSNCLGAEITHTRPGNSCSCHFIQDQVVSPTRERWRLSSKKLHVSDFICEELIEMWVTIKVLDHCHQHLLHWLMKKIEVFLKTVNTLVSIKPLEKQSPFCSWFFSMAAYLRGNQGSVTFPIATSRARKRQNELKWKHMAVTICSSGDTGWDLGFDNSFSRPPML